MHRIDTSTAQVDKFGSGKNGFTGGNPQTGVLPTALDADYFDTLQEELAGVIEAAGLTLKKGNNSQLIAAIRALALISSGAPAIGIPFYWPSTAMPNTVMEEWADMVFLKWNGANFSATTYPKLAKVIPSLILTDVRGEFIRVWDDARGIDASRTLLSSQGDAIRNITGGFVGYDYGFDSSGAWTGAFKYVTKGSNTAASGGTGGEVTTGFDASLVVPTASENRPRNIAFNFLVRAK